MTQYVWCKQEECRIPAFRCILCRYDCYKVRGRVRDGDVNPAFEHLKSSGRFKEYFIMKRKETSDSQNQLSFFERSGKKDAMEILEQNEQSENGEHSERIEHSGNSEIKGNGAGANGEKSVFLLEDGRIKPFSSDEYTSTTLYQAVETFSVECRLVRPEEPGNMVIEGKKPSKKSVPILLKKNGDCLLLNSWEELESQPFQLADTKDVVGAVPVKQVFVLKRK